MSQWVGACYAGSHGWIPSAHVRARRSIKHVYDPSINMCVCLLCFCVSVSLELCGQCVSLCPIYPESVRVSSAPLCKLLVSECGRKPLLLVSTCLLDACGLAGGGRYGVAVCLSVSVHRIQELGAGRKAGPDHPSTPHPCHHRVWI